MKNSRRFVLAGVAVVVAASVGQAQTYTYPQPSINTRSVITNYYPNTGGGAPVYSSNGYIVPTYTGAGFPVQQYATNPQTGLPAVTRSNVPTFANGIGMSLGPVGVSNNPYTPAYMGPGAQAYGAFQPYPGGYSAFRTYQPPFSQSTFGPGFPYTR